MVYMYKNGTSRSSGELQAFLRLQFTTPIALKVLKNLPVYKSLRFVHLSYYR